MSCDALLADRDIERLFFARYLYERGVLHEWNRRDDDGRPLPDPNACVRASRRRRALRLLAAAGVARA